MIFKVFTRFDSVSITEEVECDSLIIKNGAYLFLTKDWWDDSSYKNIIKAYPVTFTVIEQVIKNSNNIE